MKKLVILRGLPGSGKSTFAKQLVEAAGFKRVNKDDLRSMIDNGNWSEERETAINDAFYTLVTMFMEHGDPIVADNTHGSERHVRRLQHMAEVYGYDVEIKVFDTPIEECIVRDAGRGDASVGPRVIRRFAEQPFFANLYAE